MSDVERLPESGNGGIARAILAQAQRKPSTRVLSTPFASMTGQQLRAATFRIAASMRRRSSDQSPPIVIAMAGDVWTVAAFLAADLVNRTAVLVSTSTTPLELARALTASESNLVLAPTHTRMHDMLEGATTEIDDELSWIVPAVYPALADGGRQRARGPHGMLCHQTSGTMGSAKMALRTQSAVLKEIHALHRALEMTGDDVVVTGSAVSHSYGCIGGLLAPLLAGAQVTIARNVDELKDAIVRACPSILFGLGPSYARLLESPETVRQGLKRVRFAFSAGAPLDTEVFGGFRDHFGIPIRQDYGTSETGTIALDLDTTPHPQNVGQPLPHVLVRLQPPASIPLRGGEEGEILVRSPQLASGYLVDGGLVPCVGEDGWYGTQDAGSWIDQALRVHRRLRPLPSVHGTVVNLDTMENAIQAMPGVREVVVRPESEHGRTVLIVSVAADQLTTDEIRRWCDRSLPEHCRPHRIDVYTQLPRSPAGKIVHRYL